MSHQGSRQYTQHVTPNIKKRLTLMYKLSHNLVDISTEEHLIPNSEKRTRNSHAFKYRVPEVSKDVFKFSFFPRTVTEWNSLPAD